MPDRRNRLVQRHVHRFKLKIAPGSLGQVAAVRSAHPEIVLGVDANASFDHGTAAELDALADLDIAYVEEPFVEWDLDLAAQLRESLRAPIFADESIRSSHDVAAMLAHPAVDGITIKAGRLGWSAAQAAADAADVAGKLWRSSSLLETSVGRAFSNRLAARAVDVVSDVAPARCRGSARTPSRGHRSRSGRQSTGRPSERLITRRWISEVPSPISRIFASR